MRIGIIGARLAGSYLGLLLRQAGHEVLLFDGSAGREKPCGGGVTSKALRTMAWFSERRLPHTTVDTLRMVTRRGETADMQLVNPIRIFSRSTLDAALHHDAVEAGAEFVPLRVSRFAFGNGVWTISSGSRTWQVDFLAGADGATSSVRAAVAARFAAPDVSLALGFYVPGTHHQNTVVVAFQEPGFQGYLWSFPRVDHSSVGILRWLPHANSADLRNRVSRFIRDHYADAQAGRRFYAATIPCLGVSALRTQRVCGPGWALVGDAAGFVDAITGEGIFYALRSAELLAKSIAAGCPVGYEQAWRRDFGRDLLRAAALKEHFFGKASRDTSLVERAVRLTRRSRTVSRISDALISGNISYDGFLARLVWNSPLVFRDWLKG